MNYRFENTYTYADSQKWGVEIHNLLHPYSRFSGFALTAYLIQLSMWLPVFLFVMTFKVDLFGKALTIFAAFFFISWFYEANIFPHLSSYFNRRHRDELPNKFESVIEVDETGIRTRDRGRVTSFTWDAFHSVIDKESKVIFISDMIHCVIPAKCFPGFLEKDAFVRECNKKIQSLTSQGAVFT